MDTLYSIISITRLERQPPGVCLENLDINNNPDLTGSSRRDGYQRHVQSQDTVENNLIKETVSYVPDNMEEAKTMRLQVMSVLPKSCVLGLSEHKRGCKTVCETVQRQG